MTSGGRDPRCGTLYFVGADADPDFSPDARSVVFRRLTATGNGGLGTWDVLTTSTDGSGLSVVASGPAFRGAPDWGPQGIVFAEVDVAAGTSQLVVIQPDGSGRRAIVSLPADVEISHRAGYRSGPATRASMNGSRPPGAPPRRRTGPPFIVPTRERESGYVRLELAVQSRLFRRALRAAGSTPGALSGAKPIETHLAEQARSRQTGSREVCAGRDA